MSPATIIDGKAVAADVRADLVGEVAALRERLGRAPGLATVLVGDDGASQIYVRRKHEACAEVGIESIGHELGAGTSQRELEALVDRLNADDAVDGILVQLPLPGHIDSTRIVNRIDAAKDVDGLTTSSAGLLTQVQPGLVPCTPAGVMELLRRHGTELRGAEAVIVGRSGLVGRPLAALLLAADATVTSAHSRTRDLAAVCRRADVLVAAAGRPEMIGADMVKPGAVVIDVGTTRTDDGLRGDVDFESVREVAGAITPVPGGVGPMTIAMLLANTVRAAERRTAA